MYRDPKGASTFPGISRATRQADRDTAFDPGDTALASWSGLRTTHRRSRLPSRCETDRSWQGNPPPAFGPPVLGGLPAGGGSSCSPRKPRGGKGLGSVPAHGRSVPIGNRAGERRAGNRCCCCGSTDRCCSDWPTASSSRRCSSCRRAGRGCRLKVLPLVHHTILSSPARGTWRRGAPRRGKRLWLPPRPRRDGSPR